MNDKALSLAYSQAQGTGYKGTQEDFYNLLGSNEEAVNLAYRQASDTGYKGEIGAFSDLLGLKKKEESEFSSGVADSTEFSMLADQEPTDSDSQPTPSEQFVGTSTASPEIAQEQFSKRDQQAKDYEDFFLEREKNQADRFGVLNVVENSFKSAMSNYEKSYKDTQEIAYDGDREDNLIEDTDAIRRDNTLRRQASLDQMGVSVENQQKSFSELIFSEGETKDGLSMLFADGLTAVMDAPRTLAPMLAGPLGYAFIGVTSAADEYSGLRYDHTLTETERFNKAITSGMIEGVSNSIMGKAAIGLGAVAKTLKSKIGIEAAEAAVSGFRGLVRSTIGEGAEEGLVDIANQVKDMAFDVAYGREDHTLSSAWEDLNLYQSLDAATLGATAGSAMHASVRSLPSFKKAGHTSTIKERVEIDKEIKDLSDSYFKEVDPDIREAKKQKLNKALRAYDVLMEHEGALNDLVPAEKIQQLTAVNQRVANIMEALESGKDPAGITLSEEQIAAKKADLKQLTSIKQDIEQSAIKDYAEENKGQIPLFVEDQNGDQVEVKPVVVEDSEQQQDLEEATEPLEGQEELTQFDEAQPTAEEEVDDLSQMESDFSEIDFNEATAEGLQSAGFSSEMSSVVSRVKEGVDKIGGLNEANLVGHKTENSLRKTVAESNKEGGKAVPLQRGEFTFGFVLRKSDGSRSIHLLDVNNAELQERARENNVETPSMVDLVTEEVVTHYLLEDLFGSEGTRRSEAYNELKNIASKKNKISELISEVEAEYGLDDAKQLEEEVIAAFFVDYVKNPSKYKSAWKQIADFFNSLFKGSRVITSEAELMDVARNVSNIMSGKSVKIDIKPTEKKSEGVVNSKKESTYLKNTEIFYHFDRQSGVEMADWTVGKSSGYKGAANKVKVNDFHHFRNWYNKTTSNGEFPGIVSNMYFVKDGKKHTINPPKPKLGADGSKIKMERIASFGEARREREGKARDQELELRVQYSELGKEVGDLWYNSPLSMHTNMSDFTPEGDSEKLDFEGQIIAKKNIQAALDSEVTSEQLKEMKGRFSVVSKKDYPDLFNMSGLVRFKEAGSGDVIADGEIRFAKASKPASKAHINHFTKGNPKNIGSSEELNGVNAVDLGYDSTWFKNEKKTPSGVKRQNELRLTGRGVDPLLKGNRIITSHLTVEDAGVILGVLERQADMDARKKGLNPGERGVVAVTFNTLSDKAISGNPYIASKIAAEVKGVFLSQIESGELSEPQAVKIIQDFLNQGSSDIGFTNIPNGRVLVRQKILTQDPKPSDKRAEQGEGKTAFGYEWNLKSFANVLNILDPFIKGEVSNPFAEGKKDFINKLSRILEHKNAYEFAIENKLIDPFLTEEVAGHLIAYRTIPYTVSESGYVPELNLTIAEIPGDIGFKVAIVSKTSEFETSMKFMPELYPINEIFEGIKDIGEAKSKSARTANIQGEMRFAQASAKNHLGDIGGATWEQRSQSKTDDLKDLWLVRLQDKYRRVFKLQEDVTKQTQGQIKESEDFKNAEARLYGMAAEDLEKLDVKTKDILREMKEKKVSVEQLDEYLYALHAKERNAVIRERTEGANDMGSGKTDDWADGILNDMSSERREQLDAVTAIAREIQQDTRDSMVELGLESQETIDAFEAMFENYIPLQGLAKDEDSIEFSPYPSGKTGFSVSGKTTKRAKGRVTESSNILAQIVSQNAAIRIKGRTNEALNSLYKLVESNPNDKVWRVLDKETDKYNDSDPNIASVRVKGVQKAVWFKDASYAQSLRDMNLTNTSRFIKFLGSLNSWLRAAFTSRNPEFILSNFSRDIQAAIFNASAESEIEGGFLNGTGAMRRIFKMVGPSLKALVREEVGLEADPLIKKYYEEFKSDGGKTGWAYQKSLEDIASELEIDDSGKTAAQKILGTAKGALDFVEGMNDAFENSIRLSSYIAAREGGVSRAKSAEFAKNITVNFNKQGEWGATLNAVFLFFNASIQGTARVARSLGTLKPAARPDGSSRAWHERATNAQKVAAGLVLFNGMLTLLAQAASDEDEDGILFYNKIPDYVKERNLIIMRPDGKNYWKIPMPYGYNIFANIGTAAVETAAGHRSPLEATAFLAGATINAFSPVSFGQSEDLFKKAAKTAIPTALKPLVDVAVNETYFGGPVKAEQYPFGTPKPNSSMSFRSPEEVKQFFSWMNEATGGSDQVPGVLDINPDGYWYILEYYLGGIGKFVERSVETTRKLASDTEETPVNLDFNDVPMMRIIYGEPSKYYDFQKFKDRQVEIKQLAKEWKTDRKLNDPERYKGLSSLDAILKAYEKRLKVIRAKKRVVRKIADYSERVSKTQLLMEEERKMVMRFNKIYDEKRGK